MSRLIIHSTSVVDTSKPFIKVSLIAYLKLRIQFWKWRLHRTWGRPVLVLRKDRSES